MMSTGPSSTFTSGKAVARLLSITAILLSIAGCGLSGFGEPRPSPDLRVQAARELTTFLQALGQDGGDFGWSLLHPVARDGFSGDRSAYVEALSEASAAWRASAWDLGAITRDDDLYCAPLRFRPGYEPPPLLTDARHQVLAPNASGDAFRVCLFLSRERGRGIVGG